MKIKLLGSVFIFSACVVVIALWYFSGTSKNTNLSQSSDFSRGQCDSSAVLLEEDVDVFHKPNGYNVAKLRNGQAIYLCEISKSHRRIIYPSTGTRIDCSQRSKDFCSIGYVREPFSTMILG